MSVRITSEASSFNVRRKHLQLALVGVAVALASCAAPKAIVIDESTGQAATGPASQKPGAVTANATATTPPGRSTPSPAMPSPARSTPNSPDGLRMPDLLGLPEDKDLRSSPAPSSENGGAAVIARPPTEPPPRQKPKEKE